ncbi:unnamed protein product, partial [Trypanosoma congolense IL3000]
MMMKILIVVMVIIGVVRADEVGAAVTLTNHNELSHRALCDFLKVAVDKWKDVKTRDPADPLKKALKDTIFGYGSGDDDVEALKSKLPRDYDEVGSGLLSERSLWCGQQLDEDRVQQRRWPGHSGPHDLVCLCTAGENGWPVNSTSDTGSTLCGHNKDALEAGEKWWSGTNNTQKKDAIQKTWDVTVNQCLSGYSQETDLAAALQKFKDKIKKTTFEHETRYILGEGGPGWAT